MEIKVLGTGCPSCKTLYETTQQAIAELGSDATLVSRETKTTLLRHISVFFTLIFLLLFWYNASS